MLKLNYFLADIFILSAEKQPIKLSWRKIEWLQFVMNENSLELFSLLSDTPQVSKEEMQNAYKHFTEQIIAISQSEQSYHEIFRKLNITRIEFDSLKSSSFYELKKK